MTLKIRYLDFWPGFRAEEFLFTKLLRSTSNGKQIEIVTNPSETVDLEICSVFTFQSVQSKLIARSRALANKSLLNDYVNQVDYGFRSTYKSKARKRIWYTGENLRPPQGIFDGTISFNRTDPWAKNVFFPLIYFGLNWFPERAHSETLISPEKLILPRKRRENQKFEACSFATNLAPDRQRLVKIIEESCAVSQFGKSVGRFVPSKTESAEKYIFQICNENSHYPGYVTEKLLDAWNSGNIAIWEGAVGDDIPLKTNSFLNVTGLTEAEISQRIKSLDADKIDEMLTAPLMHSIPSIQPLIEFFKELVS
jgi:hypothetical protein